ncbi:MAG TPA: prepilin-type N-terminal cleavage/methylation domain-containing protein [Anaeromyxobacteraceae bacterium]|nr:prepilin-type N-terminal cleavage/methylation domain-containing protein [Anaeromyxobacteraceae bacterium]
MSRAFTLLEVMVALAVLSLGLMAVADLGGTALRQHGYTRDLTVATALARGKMAELEESYEDKGFKDFDETEEGDFADQGHREFAWRVEVKKPDTTLGPEQLLGVLLGQSGADSSSMELLQKLLGTGQAGAPGGQAQGAPGGVMGGVLSAQLTAFGEQLKKSFRQVTLTVAWRDGRQRHHFDVTTHLVVLNPRAPGGARGAFPDVPPNLSSPGAGLPGLGGVPRAGAPGMLGTPLPPGQPRTPRTGQTQ